MQSTLRCSEVWFFRTYFTLIGTLEHNFENAPTSSFICAPEEYLQIKIDTLCSVVVSVLAYKYNCLCTYAFKLKSCTKRLLVTHIFLTFFLFIQTQYVIRGENKCPFPSVFRELYLFSQKIQPKNVQILVILSALLPSPPFLLFELPPEFLRHCTSYHPWCYQTDLNCTSEPGTCWWAF